MADDFGATFAPFSDPSGKNASVAPVQKAIQLLSLRVPRMVGAAAPVPASLLTGPGGTGRPDVHSAVLQSVLKTIMGQGMPMADAEPPASPVAAPPLDAPPVDTSAPPIDPSAVEHEAPPLPTPPVTVPPTVAPPRIAPNPIPSPPPDFKVEPPSPSAPPKPVFTFEPPEAPRDNPAPDPGEVPAPTLPPPDMRGDGREEDDLLTRRQRSSD